MSENAFNPSMSTNEIWRGDDTTRCLTDDLNTMDANIEELYNNMAFNKRKVTSYSDGWTTYSKNTVPVIKKYGKIVCLSGELKNTSDILLNTTNVKVFNIPDDCLPSENVFAICNGSSNNKWHLTIAPDGSVYFSRYGEIPFSNVPSGSWFPFTATWIID